MKPIPEFLLTLWHKAQLLLHRQHISLMEEGEFVKTLKRVGRWDELQAGVLTCQRCGSPLSDSNVAALVLVRGEYKLICNSNDCVGRVK